MLCKWKVLEVPSYKTNPDNPAYYNKCQDSDKYEPISSEGECRSLVGDIPGATFHRADDRADWPPGCFRHPGISGKNIFFNKDPSAKGTERHVMLCKWKVLEVPSYKTNPD